MAKSKSVVKKLDYIQSALDKAGLDIKVFHETFFEGEIEFIVGPYCLTCKYGQFYGATPCDEDSQWPDLGVGKFEKMVKLVIGRMKIWSSCCK